jgi:hypothetical protein
MAAEVATSSGKGRRGHSRKEKAAFIFGGSYGKGLATCRTATDWSAPMFIAVGGGSVGFQIGASFTDGVLLFMNQQRGLCRRQRGWRFRMPLPFKSTAQLRANERSAALVAL